jgi:hypothetical protein
MMHENNLCLSPSNFEGLFISSLLVRGIWQANARAV